MFQSFVLISPLAEVDKGARKSLQRYSVEYLCRLLFSLYMLYITRVRARPLYNIRLYCVCVCVCVC